MADRRLGPGLDRVFAGDVDGECLRGSAAGGDFRGDFGQLRLIAGGKSHAGSSLCERKRAGAANALRRSGDKCGSSLK